MTPLPEAVIIDTSVLLRFFIHHDDADQSTAVGLYEAWRQDAVSLHLLDLTVHEISNVLVRRIGRSREEAVVDMDRLFRMRLRMIRVHRALAQRTVGIAAETGLSGYDAAYVAAGSTLGVQVITADRKLAALGGNRVVLLSDLAA